MDDLYSIEDEDTQRTGNGEHEKPRPKLAPTDITGRLDRIEDEQLGVRREVRHNNRRLEAVLVGVGTATTASEKAQKIVADAVERMERRGWTRGDVRLALLALFVAAGSLLWMALRTTGAG